MSDVYIILEIANESQQRSHLTDKNSFR